MQRLSPGVGGGVGIAMMDAARMAKADRARSEKLEFRAAALDTRITAARAEHVDQGRLAVLVIEAGIAVSTGGLSDVLERDLGAAHDASVTSTVSPLVNDALDAATVDDCDAALDQIIELSTCFAGRPPFRTIDGFDQWTNDPLAALTLNPDSR